MFCTPIRVVSPAYFSLSHLKTSGDLWFSVLYCYFSPPPPPSLSLYRVQAGSRIYHGVPGTHSHAALPGYRRPSALHPVDGQGQGAVHHFRQVCLTFSIVRIHICKKSYYLQWHVSEGNYMYWIILSSKRNWSHCARLFFTDILNWLINITHWSEQIDFFRVALVRNFYGAFWFLYSQFGQWWGRAFSNDIIVCIM